MASVFVDTNILLYAVGADGLDSRKTKISRELLQQRRITLSVQVLNEFFVNAVNPHKLALTDEEALLWCEQWKLLQVADLSLNTFNKACQIRTRYTLSLWDSLILASAQENHCTILYSEDLQHNQDYTSVRVINPFRIL